jgi:hypothetical protein
MSTLNCLVFPVRRVVFGKGKDPVNDKSLKLTRMIFKWFLFAVQENQQTNCPRIKHATIDSAQNYAK